MERFKVVASTCSDINHIYDIDPLETVKTSEVYYIDAEDATDAQHKFGKTKKFDQFASLIKYQHIYIHVLS